MGRQRRNLKRSSPKVKQEDEDDDYDLMSTSDVDKSETEVKTGADSDPDYDFEKDVASSGENSKSKRMDRKKTQRSTSTTYSSTEEQRQRARESYRMKILSETPEEKEERNRKNRIVRQKRIEKLSSEEFKEYCRKEKERKRRSYDKITPERRVEMYEKMRKKRAEMTPEERKERANRIYEYKKRYYKENPKSEERRRKENELQKQRNSIPERREKIRLYNRIRYHKVNNEMDPEALAAIRKHNNFQGFIRRLNRTEEDKKNDRMKKIIYRTTKEASMTEEELEAKRQRRREMTREYEKNVKGEQKERNRINSLKATRRWMKRNPDKVNLYQRRQTERETPEKRHKRLLRYKIYQGKRKLKQQLELDGVSSEDIQKQLDELTERLQRENPPPPPQDSSTTTAATGSMSVYKPRFKAKTTTCTMKDRRSQEPTVVQQVQLAPPVIINYGYDNHDTKSNDNDYDGYYAPVSKSPTSESFTPLDSPYTEQENLKISISAPCPTPPTTIPYYGKVESHPDSIHLAGSSSDKNKEQAESESTNATRIPGKHPSLNQIAKPTSKTDTLRSLPKTKTPRLDPNTTWNCPKCQAIVYSHLDLNQHYRTYHSMPNKLKKEKVLEKENSEEKVEIRERRAFSSEKIEIEIPHKFVCMKCPAVSPGSTFETKENLLAHVKRKHRKSFWPCSQCGILKYSSSSHESHVNICMKVNKNLAEIKTEKTKSSSRSKSKTAQKKRSYRKRK